MGSVIARNLADVGFLVSVYEKIIILVEICMIMKKMGY